MDRVALIEKHCPVLVMYPQDWDKRTRPGSGVSGPRGWGDYHPCSAELFLSLTCLREKPRRWEFSKMLRPWLSRFGLWQSEQKPRSARASLMVNWLGRFGLPQGEQPTGMETIRQRVVRAEAKDPGSTDAWELDVTPIPSQDSERAWDMYCKLLADLERPFEPVVYARFVEGRPATLQYWYLYVYNDFVNKHEGDWEMVTIELAENLEPRRISISTHSGGSRREWSDPKVLKDEGHPVVYVARGSHAGYYKYETGGVDAAGVIPRLNFPKPFQFLEPLQRAFHLARAKLWVIRDFPAADPALDNGFPDTDKGVRVQPTLRVLPSTASLDSEWWWLRFLGTWGSSHSRFIGTVGPPGPWSASPNGYDTRWHHPAQWLESTAPDES